MNWIEVNWKMLVAQGVVAGLVLRSAVNKAAADAPAPAV